MTRPTALQRLGVSISLCAAIGCQPNAATSSLVAPSGTGVSDWVEVDLPARSALVVDGGPRGFIAASRAGGLAEPDRLFASPDGSQWNPLDYPDQSGSRVVTVVSGRDSDIVVTR